MLSGWGFILHTFTVSTRQEGRSPARARGLAFLGQPGAHTVLQALAFLTVLSVQRSGWFILNRGRKRGGEQPEILIAALARKGWEQQPCSEQASKRPPCQH